MLRLLILICFTALSVHGSEDEEYDHYQSHRSPSHPLKLAAWDYSIPELLLKQIAKHIKGHITAKDSHYFVPGRVVFDNLTLKHNNQKIFTIEKLDLTLSVSDLLTGDIIIEKMSVNGIKLLITDNKGHINLLEAFESPKKSTNDDETSNFLFAINNLKINQADIDYRNDQNQFLHLFNGKMNSSLSYNGAKDRTLFNLKSMSAQSGYFEESQLKLNFKNLFSAGKLINQMLTLSELKLKVDDANLSLKGAIHLGSSKKIDLSGKLNTPKDYWLEKLPKKPFVLPATSINFQVLGKYDNPKLSMNIQHQAFKYQNYELGQGSTTLSYFDKKIILHASQIKFAKGSFEPTGTIKLLENSTYLDLKIGLTNLPLQALSANQLPKKSTGFINGRLKLKGSLESDIKAQLQSKLTQVRIDDFTLPHNTAFISHFSIKNNIILFNKLNLRRQSLRLFSDGRIDLKNEKLNFNIKFSEKDLSQIYKKLDPNIRLDGLQVNGRLNGEWKNPSFNGKVSVAKSDIYQIPLQKLETNIIANKNSLSVQNLTSKLLKGRLESQLYLDLNKDNLVKGSFKAIGLDIKEALNSQKQKEILSGLINVDGKISQTLDKIKIEGKISAQDLETNDIKLGAMTADYFFLKDQLSFQRISLKSKIFNLQSQKLDINLENKSINSLLYLKQFKLQNIPELKQQKLTGLLDGEIRVSGQYDSPIISGKYTVFHLNYEKIQLGSGPGLFWLEENSKTNEQILKTSLRLNHKNKNNLDDQLINLQMLYRLKSQTILLKHKLLHFDIKHLQDFLPQSSPQTSGYLNGEVSASGHINNPKLIFSFDAPDFNLKAQTGFEMYKSIKGRTTLSGEMNNKIIHLNLCAFPQEQITRDLNHFPQQFFDSPCVSNEKVWMKVVADINQLDQIQMTLKGVSHEKYSDVFVPYLLDNDMGISAHLAFDLQISLLEKKNEVTGRVFIESLQLTMPDNPDIVLEEATQIILSPENIRLQSPALLSFHKQNFIWNFDYQLKNNFVSTVFDGELSLALLKNLTPYIIAGSGGANAQISAEGPIDKLRFDGCIAPRDGANLSFRNLSQRVFFKAGRICVNSSNLQKEAYLLKSEQMSIEYAGGKTRLDGTVLFSASNSKEKLLNVHNWNLSLLGEEIPLNASGVRSVSDFDLQLKGSQESPILKGHFSLREGQIRQFFQMRNFILTRESEGTQTSLREQMQTIDLDNLIFDVNFNLQDIYYRADISTIRLHSTLEGNLHLGNSLLLPQLGGVINITDGLFVFPYASFALEQSEIEFPIQADGKINPQIYLTAKGDLQPPKTGLDTDLPAVMTLDGDLKELKISLLAENAEQNYEQTSMLRYILFGAPLNSSELTDGAASSAWRALSSELTSVFTRDLERTLKKELGTTLQFNLFYDQGQIKGGMRYQMGARLQFEGETGISIDENNQSNDAIDQRQSLNNLQLRLLIIDHFPTWWVGEDIAFEGTVYSNENIIDQEATTNLKLSYRIFEF